MHFQEEMFNWAMYKSIFIHFSKIVLKISTRKNAEKVKATEVTT